MPARRETFAQRRMTPIFVPLWFGWALKTGHKGGHFELFSGDCRNSQTRWRRGADSNPRYRELTYARNLAGAWRIIRPEQKRLCWREICSPEIRLYFGSLRFAAVRQNDATIRVMLDSQRRRIQIFSSRVQAHETPCGAQGLSSSPKSARGSSPGFGTANFGSSGRF